MIKETNMAKKSKELIQLLFPEYQIKACVDERGFIAKNQQRTNYAQKSAQTFGRGNVQQQTAPASAQLQRGAGINTATATDNMISTRAIVFFCRPPNVKPSIFFNPVTSASTC